MHAITARRRLLVIGVLTGVCALAPGTAMAERGPGGSNGEQKQENQREDQTLSSRIIYTGVTEGSGGKGGNMAPVGN